MQFNGLRRTTEPAVEPLSTADAKAYLRVDHSDEDSLIADCIAGARGAVEEYTGRALINQTWTLTASAIPADGLKIPRPPIVSVTSLEYATAETGETRTAWSDYRVDLLEDPARLKVLSQPSDAYSREDKWKLVWLTGYGAAASDIPLNIVSALKLTVANLYDNREGQIHDAVPQAAKWLLDPYRMIHI